jgi:hypothetical protein
MSSCLNTPPSQSFSYTAGPKAKLYFQLDVARAAPDAHARILDVLNKTSQVYVRGAAAEQLAKRLLKHPTHSAQRILTGA